MNFKILLLKLLMLLDFLICGFRLFHSFIVEEKKQFLKKSCFVRSWGIFSEFREKYLVFGKATSWKRYLSDWLLIILTIFSWKYLCFAEFSTKFIEIQGWMLLTFSICLLNQLSFLNSIMVQMSENVIHQIDSKNEWFLFSVTFTAKLGLVLVLTFENAFS